MVLVAASDEMAGPSTADRLKGVRIPEGLFGRYRTGQLGRSKQGPPGDRGQDEDDRRSDEERGT